MQPQKQPSAFVLSIRVQQSTIFQNQPLSREDFFTGLWEIYGPRGLLGVHEGTLLTEEAFAEGYTPEPWELDSAQAPADRDWVSQQSESTAELYFDNVANAESAANELLAAEGLQVGAIYEAKPQDWDAEWKASFLNSDGVQVGPFWRIAPPWGTKTNPPNQIILKINPGAGFGTGTHETTQLCLTALGELAVGLHATDSPSLSSFRTLDFGSGSGILGIGAALLGSQVDAVEVDLMAIENARENAELNGVTKLLHFSTEMLPKTDGPYQIILANILRPILLKFLPELLERLTPNGTLIMSGLIESDLPYFLDHDLLLKGGFHLQVHSLGDWRSIVASRSKPSSDQTIGDQVIGAKIA